VEKAVGESVGRHKKNSLNQGHLGLREGKQFCGGGVIKMAKKGSETGAP